MWKESYRVGIDSIDIQHMELFRMADELLNAIEANADKEKFQRAIEFLKNYVVRHFSDEEVYQAAVHYSGMEAHKKLHSKFTEAVLDYEKKLIETNYDIRVVKDLAGTLTAWLIYHVADADQQIAKGERAAQGSGRGSWVGSFAASTLEVLEKMVGLTQGDMKERQVEENKVTGDIFVEIGLTGETKGSAVFGFSKELAFRLIEMMTFMRPEQMDELVCSALAELANISSGNAATELSGRGVRCDIRPPIVSFAQQAASDSMDVIAIDTGVGTMEVALKPQ